MVRGVGVEPVLDGPGGQAQDLTARGGLDGLEVQPIDRPRAYERLDLGGDFARERLFEPPFLAACA